MNRLEEIERLKETWEFERSQMKAEIERLKNNVKQMANTCIRLREQLRIKGERLNKYEEPGQKCNSGHKNTLPVKLWDCPMCTDLLREEIKRLGKALKERKK